MYWSNSLKYAVENQSGSGLMSFEAVYTYLQYIQCCDNPF